MWSLGCSLACLFIGDHLFPDDKQEIMGMTVNLLGKPDNELLNRGLFTKKYFTRVQKDPAVWNLKSSEADDNFKGWNYARKFQNPGESQDVSAFLNLLKKMLSLDPKKGITPTEALGHTFITMKHLSGESDTQYFIQVNKVMTASGLQSATKPHDGTSDEPSTHKTKETSTETERSECGKFREVVNPCTFVKPVIRTSNSIREKPLKLISLEKEELSKMPVAESEATESTKLEKAPTVNIIKKLQSLSTIVHVKPVRPKSLSEVSCSTLENPPVSFSNTTKRETFTLLTCTSPAPTELTKLEKSHHYCQHQ